MRIREVYLQPEAYNPRIRATVPGAWIAEYDNGCTVAICRDYDARNAEEARKIAERLEEEARGAEDDARSMEAWSATVDYDAWNAEQDRKEAERLARIEQERAERYMTGSR